MSIYDDEELINKYLDDELTDEELAAFNKRRENDPVFNDMVNDFIETENVIEKTALYINQKKQDDFLGEYEKFLEEQKKMNEGVNTTAEKKISPENIEDNSKTGQNGTPVISPDGLEEEIPEKDETPVIDLSKEKKSKPIRKLKIYQWAVAASITAIFFLGGNYTNYLIMQPKNKQLQENANIAQTRYENLKDNFTSLKSSNEKLIKENKDLLEKIGKNDHGIPSIDFSNFLPGLLTSFFETFASQRSLGNDWAPFKEIINGEVLKNKNVVFKNTSSKFTYNVLIMNNVDTIHEFKLLPETEKKLSFNTPGIYGIDIEIYEDSYKGETEKRIFYVK